MDRNLRVNSSLILSIDVEDWPQSTWDHGLDITKRAKRNTELVLDVLTKHNVKATMFVLGKFAERFPETVKRIASEGHEIASHGYGHIEIFKQSPKQFRKDALKSKRLLEDITGKVVNGYRAPDFSIVSSTTWALEILAELGFQYDSSIFPVRNNRYGIRNWPTSPVQVEIPSGQSIIELPIATMQFLGRNLPVGGGGYHRVLPWSIIKLAINHNLQKLQPFVAYCHPYEFDSDEFDDLELKIPLKTHLHQGLGRKNFQQKFEKMLRTFPIQLASDLVKSKQWPIHTLQPCFISLGNKRCLTMK